VGGFQGPTGHAYEVIVESVKSNLSRRKAVMVMKFYAVIWLVVVAAAGLLYSTGNLNEITLTVFGFVAFTLLAAGIVAVLPWWVDEKYTWKYEAR
jgi:membrane protein YdbS with pleckstrin-like domain